MLLALHNCCHHLHYSYKKRHLHFIITYTLFHLKSSYIRGAFLAFWWYIHQSNVFKYQLLVKSSTASTGHLGIPTFCGFPNMFCRLTHTESFLFIISIYPRLSVTTKNLKECSKENTGSPLPALTTFLWLSIKMHLTSIAEFVHLVNGRRDNMKHFILKNNKKKYQWNAEQRFTQ